MKLCRISVVVCTHNPDTSRLTRTLHALLRQSIDPENWELLVVDNASAQTVDVPVAAEARSKVRLVREPRLGLTFARCAGVSHAQGEFIVLVEDDNVLAPNYLETVLLAFNRLPRVGAIGGKSLPEFERTPEPWLEPFFPLLGLRDLGSKEQFCLPPTTQSPLRVYPTCAPIGAGMALRREALESWLIQAKHSLSDRSGTTLDRGADNGIVLHVLKSGWAVGYVPELVLTHLIPAKRLEPDYLGRLNRDTQKSGMQVLTHHAINPWPPISRWSLRGRQLKAWFAHRAWAGPAARIRWRGACGQLEGRATAS
ncbi:MAG TPA: glycosyltransferase [Opitutaceae bacterium]|nr:glycosyltransferase [Opitutaceae bacterium]